MTSWSLHVFFATFDPSRSRVSASSNTEWSLSHNCASKNWDTSFEGRFSEPRFSLSSVGGVYRRWCHKLYRLGLRLRTVSVARISLMAYPVSAACPWKTLFHKWFLAVSRRTYRGISLTCNPRHNTQRHISVPTVHRHKEEISNQSTMGKK